MNSVVLSGACIALLLLAANVCQAQDSTEIPPPQAPFVAKPPPQSSWTIKISLAQPDDAPKKASQPTMKLPAELQLAVDTNQNERGVITYTDDTQLVFYIFGGRVFDKANNSPKILSWAATPNQPSSTNMPLYMDVSKYDLRRDVFPQTFWISAKTYSGIEKIEGKPYYHYESPQGQDALIEVNSLTPLIVTSQGMTYQFTRSPGPEKIPVPPEFQAAINQNNLESRAAAAMMRSNAH